ncbi:MAG: hypothetical protein U0470_05535 [Anaerolineae bacterium]
MERVRISKPERLERLLFGQAVAEFVLKSLATDCLLRGDAWEVDKNIAGSPELASGWRAALLRRSVWNGGPRAIALASCPMPLNVAPLPTPSLQRFYRRLRASSRAGVDPAELVRGAQRHMVASWTDEAVPAADAGWGSAGVVGEMTCVCLWGI